MFIWSKIWSAFDMCFLWMLDSDSEALVRQVAERIPDDPRELALFAERCAGTPDVDHAAA